MGVGGVASFAPGAHAQAKPSPDISEAKTTKGRNSSKTVRKVRVAEEDVSVAPAVIQAETAIEKRDYAQAEALLQKVVADDPRDARAWFDLGYVMNVTGRKTEAIAAYKRSVAIKPTVQEANLNLGILLAGGGQNEEAAKYLRAATTLKPDSKDSSGPYRAWLSLGRVLQASAPAEAVAAFREAAKLDAKDAEPHLSLASL
ncbi:MAG: tetratricopeptide repeat protein, partial [Terriglobales bacterium]